jgi:hypothetical protein
MSGIGGLDVSYGARHQIVRTNVAVVNVDSGHAMTESMGKCFFDLLHQGLAGTILEPDFIVPILAGVEATSAWGTDLTTVATSLFEVDTTGNGTSDSTLVNKGPLLRYLGQTPLTVNSGAQAALETGTVQTSNLGAFEQEAGNMVLEAVLNTGLCQLGSVGIATSAFGAGTVEAGATASIALGGIGEMSGAVQSAAMASAFNGLESGDSHTAGSPEAHVGLLNFIPLAEGLTETAIQGGAVMPDLNTNIAAVTALVTDFETNGRAQANAAAGKATFKNLMAVSDDTQLTGLCIGIASTISICKVL